MSDPVRLDITDGLAVITLARPEKLNALDDVMVGLLGRYADAIDADRSVRAVILTGEGKAFCAGGDIVAWGGLSPLEMGQGWVRSGHRVFDKLARMKPPVIAALNGHALGGGLELAVTADIRICEAQAKIGLPESGLGMIPGWSGTQRLVRRLGGQVARRLALTGEIVTAETAATLGIVDQVVEKGGSLAAAKAMAERVAARGPVANIVVKQLINAAEDEDRAAIMETLASSLVSYTEDVKEGVAAFQDKRTPRYRGE
ncbi:enoyl-CoA hydratase/isomerase family protein [Bosea caraganae]|uniref:Enoyl-CoA hydratase/isomerase family protein n=1 Tax=Bosea caraganae TaxID=2763117 RepID=A0A370KYB8_9HYPH|nr:enoyl-CoA hydratase/isomerase family protein [Bosea caraganae]RDJ19983.1 enoyl-CoA hydratase/isomerase family protein [Bosea caraganae]RDJ23923.1 enoyl-CoA hydratase/isomerase family protein [Bosea caraganae]